MMNTKNSLWMTTCAKLRQTTCISLSISNTIPKTTCGMFSDTSVRATLKRQTPFGILIPHMWWTWIPMNTC